MSQQLPELSQPLWFEIAVPDPVTGLRAVLWTGPLTVDGVAAGMAALSPYQNQHRLDAYLTGVVQARERSMKRNKP